MTSPLERLTGKSLAKEPPDAEEFAGLRKSGLTRLADAGNASVSLEGRFDLDERIVADMVEACRKIARKVEALPPIR